MQSGLYTKILGLYIQLASCVVAPQFIMLVCTQRDRINDKSRAVAFSCRVCCTGRLGRLGVCFCPAQQLSSPPQLTDSEQFRLSSSRVAIHPYIYIRRSTPRGRPPRRSSHNIILQLVWLLITHFKCATQSAQSKIRCTIQRDGRTA